MITTVDKLRGLVEALYNKTSTNELTWALSSDKQSVWADIGGYRVQISEEQLESFEKDLRVTVFNNEGDQVDTFSDGYFRGLRPVNVQIPNYYQLMTNLLESARRQANGADAAIEKILGSLGGAPVSDHGQTIGFADDLDSDVPF